MSSVRGTVNPLSLPPIRATSDAGYRLLADATLAFAFVALSTMVPTLRDPAKQRAGVFLWSAVLIVLFSVLMNIFKVKNGCESRRRQGRLDDLRTITRAARLTSACVSSCSLQRTPSGCSFNA